VPPSPATPVPGAIDDYLKTVAPQFGGWDIGVNERVRFEDKDDAGTTHAGSNFDFFNAPPSDNSNQYRITRLLSRIAYNGDLLSIVVDARSSYALDDDRYTATAAGKNMPEDDGPLQLQMAYILIGNLKDFPVTAKIGRQELIYGDSRLVGNAYWLNVPHTFDAVKLRYQNSFFGVDIFAANLVYVDADHFENSNRQDTLSGAYFDFPGLSKDNVTEIYVFARNVPRGIVTDNWSNVSAPFRFTAPQDIYTLGYHMKSKPNAFGPWDYGFETMWQFGDRTAVFPATTVAAAKIAPRLEQNACAFVL
jgi:hypothetical protein